MPAIDLRRCLASGHIWSRPDVIDGGVPRRTPPHVIPSQTGAGARIRNVDSRRAARRHAREGDVQHVWNRAGVNHVVDLACSFNKPLPYGVSENLALAADGFVDGEVALVDNDDRSTWMRVPSR